LGEGMLGKRGFRDPVDGEGHAKYCGHINSLPRIKYLHVALCRSGKVADQGFRLVDILQLAWLRRGCILQV
jgi:hypothetical protein